ncbi:Exonuclease SbcC [Plantibacter sp. T3]|nr:Exonuclease SbcC [Plantibacter sp. T3]
MGPRQRAHLAPLGVHGRERERDAHGTVHREPRPLPRRRTAAEPVRRRARVLTDPGHRGVEPGISVASEPGETRGHCARDVARARFVLVTNLHRKPSRFEGFVRSVL